MKKLYPPVFIAFFLSFLPGINLAANTENSSSKTVVQNPNNFNSRNKEKKVVNASPGTELSAMKTELQVVTQDPQIKNADDVFLEKWEVVSSKPVNPSLIKKEYTLSSNSYFKFLDYRTVIVKLNDDFPEQVGEVVQSPLTIKIKLIKNPDCKQCVESMVITKNSIDDKDYVLEIQGYKQSFAVNSIR